ncbi:MAG: MarR family winged helix-turn-helix transcriptional regulator [Acidobacteriota bacterium]
MTPSSVHDEIRQRRPFRSPGHEAAVVLLRTADVVRQAYGPAIEPRGLTFQQYNVLRILRGAGAEGLPTLEIAERMVERAPGITRLLDRLERKGLVRRERCARDRRRVLCWPTPAALALLAELDPAVDAADATVVAALSERERQRLTDLLDRVRAGFAARDTDPATPNSPAHRRDARGAPSTKE